MYLLWKIWPNSIKWWKPFWICTWEFYAGLKKTRIPACLLEKQLSHVACLGQLLACLVYFLLENDLPGPLSIGQVGFKSHLHSENNLLVLGLFSRPVMCIDFKFALNFRSWIINRYVLSHDAILQLWHSPHLWSWTQGMAKWNINVCLEGDISPLVLNLTLSLLCCHVSESPYSKQYSSFKIYEKSCVVLITYSTTWGLTHLNLNAFDSFLAMANNTSLEWVGTIKYLGVIFNNCVLDSACQLHGEKDLLWISLYASHFKDPIKINDWMNEFNKLDRLYLLAHNPG